MRRFVCDRLTAAAQEILGAYEKKIEGYEAEIARQRRLLDAVLTPELKLHRTELPQRHVQKLEEDDEVLVIQPQHFDQATSSSHVPPDPPPVKEEQEELCLNLMERLLQYLNQALTTSSPLTTLLGAKIT
ncbi:hypothetical protein NQZ68_029075 [Dissostichus eleginoides]|nr:hypothetical protein NQZ68_029075 [Dissostichus eleginoides]